MFSLIAKSQKLSLPVDIQLELFDQLVTPVLLYGSEVWGFEDLSQLETFHLKYCKQLTKVNRNTANCMMYGELGRSSLSKAVESRITNYWCKIVNSKSSKLSHIIYRLLKTLHDRDVYKSPWICKVKKTLDNTGMSYLWQNNAVVNKIWFKHTINQKLNDTYKQKWNAEMQSNGLCTNYKSFKSAPTFEKYLILLDPVERINLCKFRCGSHRLPIAQGRFQGIDRNLRHCNLCTGQRLGDEFHYLFECPSMSLDRNQFIKRYYRNRPSMFKMVQLFNSENKKELSNLAKLCRNIMVKF